MSLIYCTGCKKTVNFPGDLSQVTPDRYPHCGKCLIRTEPMLTITEYNTLSPYHQGFASYMQACRPLSPLSNDCPYQDGTKEKKEWLEGRVAASISVQDMEE